MRDLNLLDSIVEELPTEVIFESANQSVINSSLSLYWCFKGKEAEDYC